MRNCVDKFSMALDNFGLCISIKKTEVIHQSAPRKQYVEPNITIEGQRLKLEEKFTYLGSTISSLSSWMTRRTPDLQKWLNRNVWNRRGISETTKIKVYRAVVITTLLYVCETWTSYQQHIKKLNHLHTTRLRKILGNTWQKHMADTEVLTSLPSIYTILMQSQFRWPSHVHMKDNCLPKIPFYGELSQETRKSASKTHWRSPWNLSVSPLIAWNIWRLTETSDVKLSNVEQKPEKPEETQQLSCARNLEKPLPHQPLPLPFLVLTVQ